jgi:hypothetical protein
LLLQASGQDHDMYGFTKLVWKPTLLLESNFKNALAEQQSAFCEQSIMGQQQQHYLPYYYRYIVGWHQLERFFLFNQWWWQ